MGFELCHPAVNFLYFAAVLAGMIAFQHPVFLAISFFCAVAYSIKRRGVKAAVFVAALLPFVAVFAWYYSRFHHFGVTVLERNFLGNNMTLESLVYGLVLGFVIAGVLIWLGCVFHIFTTDKVVYLFGKVSPRLSLFLAILLRMCPRIGREAKRINMAQRGIGRGVDQGNVFQRLKNAIRIFSMLITWMIGALALLSDSMGSRGSSLRGRTAFSIYRFDDRDKTVLCWLVFCGVYIVCGWVTGGLDWRYYPTIKGAPMLPIALSFQLVYLALCFTPVILNRLEDRKWKHLRSET